MPYKCSKVTQLMNLPSYRRRKSNMGIFHKYLSPLQGSFDILDGTIHLTKSSHKSVLSSIVMINRQFSGLKYGDLLIYFVCFRRTIIHISYFIVASRVFMFFLSYIDY